VQYYMSELAREVNNVQNPALGAFLIWSFVKGYNQSHASKGFPPLQLLFLVLPIVLHRQTYELLKSTQTTSGLKTFSGKFSKSSISQRDVLVSLQPRIILWRNLSWASIQIALANNLIVLDLEGTVLPISQDMPKPKILSPIKNLVRESEKLGVWCGQLSLSEIGILLHIQF
jgi:hypothetical protein